MRINSKFSSIEEVITAYGGFGNLKLDLGSGYYAPIGFIGCDDLSGAPSQIASENLPAIDIDLHRETLPFPDDSCLEVRTSHYLEHSNLDLTFREVHRVLKKNGKFNNTFPHAFSSEGLYPGHSIFLTEKWFRENLIFNELFQIESFTYKPHEYYLSWPWFLRKLIPLDFGRNHLFNVASEVYMVATPRK